MGNTGKRYTEEERKKLVVRIQDLKVQGYSTSKAVKEVGISKSTYLGWLSIFLVRQWKNGNILSPNLLN